MPLRVDTAIPYGNAADIEIIPGTPPTVAFTAATHGGPEALWFCFRVELGDDRPAQLKLLLKHPQTLLAGGDFTAMRPVYRAEGGDWVRSGPGTIETLPDGRIRVAWLVPAETPRLDFAFCYPYGLPEQEALAGLGWRLDTIGVSQGDRPLVRAANDYGAPQGQRPGVYCIARQHAAETSGGWALDGFLRRIAELGDRAPLVWAVPLSNLDGVVQGDYGKDNYPYDLNRAWDQPQMRHETLVIQRDMGLWRQRCRPALALDWHAPGGCEAEGVYLFRPQVDKPEVATALDSWLEVIAPALGDLGAESRVRTASYRSRWETYNFTKGTGYVLGLPALTFEVPYALAGQQVFTRELYQSVGRRVADALAAKLAD